MTNFIFLGFINGALNKKRFKKIFEKLFFIETKIFFRGP